MAIGSNIANEIYPSVAISESIIKINQFAAASAIMLIGAVIARGVMNKREN